MICLQKFISCLRVIFFILPLLFSHSISLAYFKVKKTKPIPAALIFDASNNKVLYARNSMRKIHPASLTKLMTVYIAFERIKNKRLRFEDNIIVSKNASLAKPSRLGLSQGERIKCKTAIEATIIKSANDAAKAIADHIGGSERRFVQIMNKKAKDLGMRNTTFRNASGWHDPVQKTTAADLVKLAVALKRDFPEYYQMFAKTSFAFKNKTYHGHNHVVKSYAGAEGMKTGYISASGYNLITSAKRGNKRLIGVIIGGKSSKERDEKMVALLNKYFAASSKKIVTAKKAKSKSSLPKQIATDNKRNKVA